MKLIFSIERWGRPKSLRSLLRFQESVTKLNCSPINHPIIDTKSFPRTPLLHPVLNNLIMMTLRGTWVQQHLVFLAASVSFGTRSQPRGHQTPNSWLGARSWFQQVQLISKLWWQLITTLEKSF